jgi:hypothetical protein
LPIDFAKQSRRNKVVALLNKLKVSLFIVSLSVYLSSPLLCLPQNETWLSFGHGAFYQNQETRQQPKQSSLSKMIGIADLFRFISEFVIDSDDKPESSSSEEDSEDSEDT